MLLKYGWGNTGSNQPNRNLAIDFGRARISIFMKMPFHLTILIKFGHDWRPAFLKVACNSWCLTGETSKHQLRVLRMGQPFTIARLGTAARTELNAVCLLCLTNKNKTEHNGLHLVPICSHVNLELLHWERGVFFWMRVIFRQEQIFVWCHYTSRMYCGKFTITGIFSFVNAWMLNCTMRSPPREFSCFVPAKHNVPGQLLFSYHLSL